MAACYAAFRAQITRALEASDADHAAAHAPHEGRFTVAMPAGAASTASMAAAATAAADVAGG
eukprot:4144905-Prymnesium_polylepis.1